MARLSGRPLLDVRADATLFVDRDAELERLTRAVAEGLNVLVSAPRGLGRTSLLRHLAFQRTEGPRVRVLDATAHTDAAEFLRGVAAALEVPLPADGASSASASSAAASSAAELVAVLAGDAFPSGGAAVLGVDGLSPIVGHAVFGQLRDEVWRIPLTWLLSCAEVDEAAFLRPPADAFFDATVRLPPLRDEAVRDLLRRRTTPTELNDEAVAEVVSLAGGSPRRAIDLARHLLLAPATGTGTGTETVTAVRDRLLDREQTVARLGTPARMLLAELEALGGASASDERLLGRLGWTRARAAQVLGELEREGLVEASEERGAVGRPRRIYRSKDWLTG